MRWDRDSVREGMFVTSTKGERIGKVIRRDVDMFVVEKGTLFPKDYELRYDHIAGLSGGEISYSLNEVGQREERLPGVKREKPRSDCRGVKREKPWIRGRRHHRWRRTRPARRRRPQRQR